MAQEVLDTTGTADPGTAGWWIRRLTKQLQNRSGEVALWDEYYEGDQRLAFATEAFLKAFGGLFRSFSDNWCALVADAVEERLDVQGFTMTPDDQKTDDEAWRIWQENNMDLGAQIAHTEALIAAEVYGLVWWRPGTENDPQITIEHPSEMIVETDPADRRVRRAALKVWHDAEAARIFVTLYLPGEILKYESQTTVEAKSGDLDAPQIGIEGRILDELRLVPRDTPDGLWRLENPLGVVPVVTLANRPRLLRPGISEIAPVIPTQDAINKMLMDMLVASEYAGFRQRWIAGIEVPKDPETNAPLPEFTRQALDRMLTSDSPETKFGSFDATDLGNYVQAIEMLVEHVAARTRTPPHYFLQLKGTLPSGETLKSAETGLIAKVRRRQLAFGEGWEEIMRLCFAVRGDAARANARSAATIWADPESRSESEHTDALVKLKSLGVPDRVLWKRAGFTAQEIEEIESIIASGGGQPPAGPAVPVDEAAATAADE